MQVLVNQYSRVSCVKLENQGFLVSDESMA